MRIFRYFGKIIFVVCNSALVPGTQEIKSLASGSSERLILEAQVLISLEEKGVKSFRRSWARELVWETWGYRGVDSIEEKEEGDPGDRACETAQEEELEASEATLYFFNHWFVLVIFKSYFAGRQFCLLMMFGSLKIPVKIGISFSFWKFWAMVFSLVLRKVWDFKSSS